MIAKSTRRNIKAISSMFETINIAIRKIFDPTLRGRLLSHAYKRVLTARKKQNEALNNKEYKQKRLRLESVPPTYILGLTNICNLRCPLCITGLGQQQKEKMFMGFRTAEKIIEKIRDYAIWVQLYNWGESLLHKDFIRILCKAKEDNLAVQLSTNLDVKYNESLFYTFVEAQLDHMIVSFDGLSQETYSRYRVGGDIENVMENIRQIAKIKKEKKSYYPVIDLQFLVNKYNFNEVAELKRTFKDLGADYAYATETVLPFKCNDKSLAEQWLAEEEIEKRKYLDVDLWTLYKVCQFLYKFMIIDQDGSIPPCCYVTDPDDDFTCFDDSKSISDLFNNDIFINARKLFNNRDHVADRGAVNNLVCRQCSVYKSYMETTNR
jgi:MoaA/NifB/PqqE/SkfB family radical SAM enzyme